MYSQVFSSKGAEGDLTTKEVGDAMTEQRLE